MKHSNITALISVALISAMLFSSCAQSDTGSGVSESVGAEDSRETDDIVQPPEQVQFTDKGIYYNSYGDNSFSVVGVDGTQENLTVPASYGGIPVVTIESLEILGEDGETPTGETNNKLKNITVPHSVEQINYDCFDNCAALENIFVDKDSTFFSDDDGVLYSAQKELVRCPIGKSDSYEVLSGTKTVSGCAFRDCGLAEIHLPKTVEETPSGAFIGCDMLEGIYVEAGSLYYTSVSGVLFDAYIKRLIWYPAQMGSEFAFPDGMTQLSGTLTVSGTEMGFENVTRIILPASLTMIDEGAFELFTALTEISVSPDNMSFCTDGAALFTKNMTRLIAFPKAREGEYIIPDSVTSIDYTAFRGCSLSSVIINEGIKEIRQGAFKNCAQLESVTLPESAEVIEGKAFSGTAIKTLTVPASVTHIQEKAFSGCAQLESINVEEGNEAYSSADGVVFTDDKRTTLVFFPEGRTGEYTIPDTTTRIASLAFYNCGINNVTIPDSVTVIDANAFYRCAGLESICVPGSVENLEAAVFYSCKSLKSAELREGTVSMGHNVFAECPALEKALLPDSLKTLAADTFFNCGALNNISFGGASYISFDEFSAAGTSLRFDDFLPMEGVLFDPDEIEW